MLKNIKIIITKVKLLFAKSFLEKYSVRKKAEYQPAYQALILCLI